MPSNEDPATGAALPIGDDHDSAQDALLRVARLAKDGQLTDDEVAGLTDEQQVALVESHDNDGDTSDQTAEDGEVVEDDEPADERTDTEAEADEQAAAAKPARKTRAKKDAN